MLKSRGPRIEPRGTPGEIFIAFAKLITYFSSLVSIKKIALDES